MLMGFSLTLNFVSTRTDFKMSSEFSDPPGLDLSFLARFSFAFGGS